MGLAWQTSLRSFRRYFPSKNIKCRAWADPIKFIRWHLDPTPLDPQCFLEFGFYIFLSWATISGDQCSGTEIILRVITTQKASISMDWMMITTQDTPWSDGGPQLCRPLIHPPNASQKGASDDMDGEPIWSLVDGIDESKKEIKWGELNL